MKFTNRYTEEHIASIEDSTLAIIIGSSGMTYDGGFENYLLRKSLSKNQLIINTGRSKYAYKPSYDINRIYFAGKNGAEATITDLLENLSCLPSFCQPRQGL